MTAEEMGREFDLLYNNIMSNAAPGIDEYEKSVFLTKAQEQLVTAIYDGTFEGSEKLRECINPLVTTDFADTKTEEGNIKIITGKQGLDKNSKFFELPDNAWYILYEDLSPISDDECDGSRRVLVKPIKLDEYYKVCKNPFRKARKTEALRLNTEGLVEVISTYEDYKYNVRYLRKPDPIIISNGEADLTIDSVPMNVNKDCELLEALHRPIVETAVSLAIAAYKSTNQ